MGVRNGSLSQALRLNGRVSQGSELWLFNEGPSFIVDKDKEGLHRLTDRRGDRHSSGNSCINHSDDFYYETTEINVKKLMVT